MNAPVFVVGGQRSGTTLLASLIAAHPDLESGPEAKVFEKVSASERAACVADPAWPRRAVSALLTVRLSGERVTDLFGLDQAALTAYLANRPPSEGALLAAMFEAGDRLAPGQRWVEKTPNHIEHVAALQREFPDARFVRILRDPRDVAASLAKVPWGSPSPLANAWAWREQVRRTATPLAALAGALLTVRYEDLLSEPEAVMRRVAAHIGVAFTPEMLDPERGSAAVTTAAETWKAKNASSLDPARAFAWRAKPGAHARAIGVLCADELRDFAYPDVPRVRARAAALIARKEVAAAMEDALLAAGDDGVRVERAGRRHDGTLLVPRPGALRRAGLPDQARAAAAVRRDRRAAGLSTRALTARAVRRAR
ncbi:sulfotransferase [Microbacterium excoecariae]|uniref:sulfotransferase n=1 Tax=Microbacterium excoecariae TaxID=2715210 RepID=UPI00140E5321|nr:sulfotransferase [Microbacterium excoecariae]